jgi:hypothetical protein
MPDTTSVSSFANSRANLRETAKWVTTSTAAIVVLVVGGSSFSQLGSLDLGPRLLVAIASIALGSFLCWFPFRTALAVISSNVISLERIANDAAFATSRGRVNGYLAHRYPPQLNSLEALYADYEAQHAIARDRTRPKADRLAAYKRLDRLRPYVVEAMDIFNTDLVRTRFDELIQALKKFLVPVLACFLLFAWSANPGKDLEKPLKTPYQTQIARDPRTHAMFTTAKLAPQCFDGTVSLIALDERPGRRIGAVAVPTGPSSECNPVRVTLISPWKFAPVD